MLDQYKRKINYLRISVTDRCNLRCTYCMPAEGIKLMAHDNIISFEEIAKVVHEGVLQGINKIRLTGGEPLVRKGIVDLVRQISQIEGVEDLSMTTNGILLVKYADNLAQAGLNRVNISLDTTSPERYASITRGGDINQVYAGIRAAKKANLSPIKINCVVFKNRDEEDAKMVAAFCEANDLQIRYIHQMDLKTGEFSIVEGGEGGDCKACNRLRLTANGEIRPCLFNDMSFQIKEQGIEKAYADALDQKPLNGTKSLSGNFYGIGG